MHTNEKEEKKERKVKDLFFSYFLSKSSLFFKILLSYTDETFKRDTSDFPSAFSSTMRPFLFSLSSFFFLHAEISDIAFHARTKMPVKRSSNKTKSLGFLGGAFMVSEPSGIYSQSRNSGGTSTDEHRSNSINAREYPIYTRRRV